MKNVSLRVAAVAVALAAALPASATNGMRVIGFGPVQNSMGGASVAAPLDSSTIVSNPAGLSAIDRRADISGSLYTPTVKYDASWTPNGTNMFASSQSSDRAPDLIPTLGFVTKPIGKLSVGIAALGTSGLGVDYAQGGGLYNSATLTSYANMRVAPAAAYRITDELSVGVALNLMYAWMKYDVAGAMGMLPRDTAYSFGYGATFGLSYQAPKNVTLAASYETKSQFQDFEFDLATGKEKLAFDQPDILSGGVAYRPIAALLLAFDYQWIRWSTTQGKDQPKLEQAAADSRPFNMNWDDQQVFKIGAQYEVTKELAIRLGYNYGTAILDATRAFENVAFPANVKQHFTAGAGYAFGAFAVNASVQYAPEVKVTGSNPLEQGITAYETKVSQLAFDLGASWKF